MEKKNEIGGATGLAWTEVGGQLLTVECTLMEGKGKLTITGKLGEVMQESAQAAMSYIRSRAMSLGIPRDFYRNLDVRLHIPEGADSEGRSKSAGITLATTICSALTKIPGARLAMLGDDGRGSRCAAKDCCRIWRVDQEKLMAAHRCMAFWAWRSCRRENEKDLPDIPDAIKKTMKLHFVESMDEVLKIALEREIVALPIPGAELQVEGSQSAEETVAH